MITLQDMLIYKNNSPCSQALLEVNCKNEKMKDIYKLNIKKSIEFMNLINKNITFSFCKTVYNELWLVEKEEF